MSEIVISIGVWIANATVIARVLRGDCAGMARVYNELWPFARYYGYPAVIVSDIKYAMEADHAWVRVLWILAALIWILIWWQDRKPPDDRWKKRRKKALAHVKQVGGRLVVIPVPSPVPTGTR